MEFMKITKLVPWLVKAAGTGWGEYFFVEVRTDEGVTGWGEITTTTRSANRAVAGIIRQLNDLLVGEDPAQIERIWHKTFRSFTYMGTRGATTQCGQRHRHRAVGHPRQGAGPADLRSCWAARCATISCSTRIPTSRNFGTDEGVVKEIRAIVDSGHTALKFDPFPHLNGIGPPNDGYLDGGMSKQGEKHRRRTHRSYARNRRPRHRNPDRRARPLQRADRDPAVPQARGRRPDRLVRGAGAGRELSRAASGAREGQRRTSASASGCTRAGRSCRYWRTGSPTISCRM